MAASKSTSLTVIPHHGDLPRAGTDRSRHDSARGHTEDEAGALEQAVEVMPLPVAVFLGRGLEGPLAGTAILQLLGG